MGAESFHLTVEEFSQLLAAGELEVSMARQTPGVLSVKGSILDDDLEFFTEISETPANRGIIEIVERKLGGDCFD